MKNKFSLLLIFLLMLALFLPLTAAAASIFDTPEVPKAAKDIVDEMDRQLQKYYLNPKPNDKLSDELQKKDITIVSTVPVWIDDLKVTNPLSRQMSEEISAQLAKNGYSLIELRKAYELTIEPREGEFLLTRELDELASIEAEAVAVVTGTYIISTDNIRYNISLLHVPTNEVLAKASATVPIRDEIYPLLYDNVPPPPLMPSVKTKLQ